MVQEKTQAETGNNEEPQKEKTEVQTVNDPKISGIRKFFRKLLNPFVIATTIAHAGLFHEAVSDQMAYLVEYGIIQLDPRLTGEKKAQALRELNFIQKFNERRKINKIGNEKELKEYQKSLKGKDLLAESWSKIGFERDHLEQGVEREITEKGEKNYREKIAELQEMKPPEPDQHILADVVDTFAPDYAYGGIMSTASDTLALGMCEKSQNCEARNDLIVMAMADLYPEYKNNIYSQHFFDHVRVIYRLPNGKRYVMERGISRFPDHITKRTHSVLISAHDELKIFAGIEGIVPEKIAPVIEETTSRGNLPYLNITNTLKNSGLKKLLLSLQLDNYAEAYEGTSAPKYFETAGYVNTEDDDKKPGSHSESNNQSEKEEAPVTSPTPSSTPSSKNSDPSSLASTNSENIGNNGRNTPKEPPIISPVNKQKPTITPENQDEFALYNKNLQELTTLASGNMQSIGLFEQSSNEKPLEVTFFEDKEHLTVEMVDKNLEKIGGGPLSFRKADYEALEKLDAGLKSKVTLYLETMDAKTASAFLEGRYKNIILETIKLRSLSPEVITVYVNKANSEGKDQLAENLEYNIDWEDLKAVSAIRKFKGVIKIPQQAKISYKSAKVLSKSSAKKIEIDVFTSEIPYEETLRGLKDFEGALSISGMRVVDESIASHLANMKSKHLILSQIFIDNIEALKILATAKNPGKIDIIDLKTNKLRLEEKYEEIPFSRFSRLKMDLPSDKELGGKLLRSVLNADTSKLTDRELWSGNYDLPDEDLKAIAEFKGNLKLGLKCSKTSEFKRIKEKIGKNPNIQVIMSAMGQRGVYEDYIGDVDLKKMEFKNPIKP